MKTILDAKNVYKVFGNSNDGETTILKGVDLQIKDGEFVAIMGHSGSGKSTLLYNISGMDRLTSGNVLYDGNDISSLSDKQISEVRLHNMGFIFQHSHLLKILSIKENIMLPALKAKKKSRDEILNDTEELMQKVGIESISEHDITKVSGGQLQRAAICRALINNPNIIFGDEPTGALNSRASREVMDILNEINHNGTTLLIVTHDSKIAARAERVIYLSDGNIEDEYKLGKYDGKQESLIKREDEMSKWLKARGF
ncbi:ABC transporter ATP-binding protein [Haloplasma contractile]|uniref:ABC transporter ATP-binding protein n=1 Tax=Haloplasma contractile SSD-17B TaxID=1033810 RepID=U2E6T3_9MOLU|nr:ABC transporter ATP-binding protein [Haloplasma contractile]ERJ10928.1 ABC transporter ATP-binding protein [Haloplasma contractile SSD-17B]